MTHPNADRNLLYGILALQMDFISRDQLVAAMHVWMVNKGKPLGEILVEQHSLSQERRTLLEVLVDEHLKQHSNDPSQSLAATTPHGPLYEDLRRLADADLESSLIHLARTRDAGQTGESSVGTSGPSQGPRFRVLSFHAEGGLGKVSKAQDDELNRLVALKEIKERFADVAESRCRFVLEAEITGGLQHPGIVPVYGLGQYGDGRPFYAMRFIDGDSLKDAIDNFHHPEMAKRDPSERALMFRQLLGRFVDVCDAMEYAHSRGVLHRDLKPGNIMLGRYGETLVVDWGLAKPMHHAGKPNVKEPPLEPSLSGNVKEPMGLAIGTPQFMSPEQADGRLDLMGPTSDVYSLGATLYCLLAGKSPFEDRETAIVLQRVRRGDFARPRKVVKHVPPALEAICLKAMALEQADRYPTPRALADDLEHWLADEPVLAYREPWNERLARWTRRHRTLMQATAASLLAITAVSVAAALVINHYRQEAVAQRNEAEFQRGQANEQRLIAVEQRGKAEHSFREARGAVDRYHTLVSENRLLNEPGLQGLRKELLQAALEYYQSFLSQRTGDPSVQQELANAWFRVGKITSLIGSKEEARQAFESAVKLQTALKAESDNPEITYELSNSWNELGRLDLQMGKYPAAMEAFEKSRGHRESLVQDHPDNVEYQRKLASSYMNLGNVQFRNGKPKESEGSYRKSLDIQQRLADANPDNAMVQRDLAMGQYNMALAERQRGDASLALISCRKSLEIYERLVQLTPGTIELQGLLGLTYRIVDDLASEIGQSGEALAAFQKARQLIERLVKDNPLVSDYRADLAGVLLRIAQFEPDRTQAVVVCERARDLLRQLVAENPDVVRYHSDLAGAYLQLGLIQHSTAQLPSAMGSFQEALRISQRVAEKQPGKFEFQDAVAQAYTNIALVERAMPGGTKAALMTYGKARQVYDVLATANAESPEVLEGLARVELNVGLVQDQEGQHEAAANSLQQALAHQRAAVAKSPQAPRFARRLGSLLGEVATLHRVAGRLEEAIAACKERRDRTVAAAELVEIGRSFTEIAAALGKGKDDVSTKAKVSQEELEQLALETLRDAVAAGSNVNILNDDPVLAPLKSRAGWKAVLEAKRR